MKQLARSLCVIAKTVAPVSTAGEMTLRRCGQPPTH